MLKKWCIKHPDGRIARGLAYFSYRCGPTGEWVYNDIYKKWKEEGAIDHNFLFDKQTKQEHNTQVAGGTNLL